MSGKKKLRTGIPCRTSSSRCAPSSYFSRICPLRTPTRASSTHCNELGFTLIEILVVVLLVGVLAAIVILNIGGFTGRGSESAANVEAHQVQTAIVAYMETNALRPEDLPELVVNKDGPPEIEQYLLNIGTLQAQYTITSGRISDAYAYADGRWAGCTWDTDAGQWRKAE